MTRRPRYQAVLLALALAACATAPERASEAPSDASSSATRDTSRTAIAPDAALLGPLTVHLDGALPLIQSTPTDVLASSIALGQPTGPLHYRARYALSPGSMLIADQFAQRTTPRHVGSQHVDHDVRLHLLSPAGAPLALRYSREMEGRWHLDGGSDALRQMASLSWAPAAAQFDLQWAGDDAVPRDADAALRCSLTGSVRVPLAAGTAPRDRSVRLSGRGCDVVPYREGLAGLNAVAFGLNYSSQRAQRLNTLRLSAIDSGASDPVEHMPRHTSYELRWSQSRRYDTWSARAEAALRRAGGLPTAPATSQPIDTGAATHWITGASLTRRLPAFSVSANWTYQADPYWFIPEKAEPADRFSLNVDFSRWAANLAAPLNPDLSLSWHWSQLYPRDETTYLSRDNAVRLDMSATW